ncbi:hypothetical protein DRQ33_08540, partial [bacterium]
SNPVMITVGEYIIEDAIWDTSYYLTMLDNVPDTTPHMIGEGWYSTDIWVDIYAQDSIFRDSVWYHFDHWSGAVFGDSTSNQDSVFLDYAHTITANYVPNPEIEVFPPESTVARRGDNILIPAIFDAVIESELDSFQFDIVFDTTQLSFDTVEYCFVPWSELNYSRIADTIRVFADQSAPIMIAPPETLFFYSFGVKLDASYGCNPLDMYNFLFDLSDAETNPGTLCVYPETVAVSVTNDFDAGSVWVDAIGYEAPYSSDWLGGEVHTISAESIYTPAIGVELRFDTWSDGGIRTHDITPVSDSTFIAQYDSFFYLTVLTDHGTPSGEDFYLAHTSAIFSVVPETVYEVSGLTRYVFDSWDGDYIGTDNPGTIWMNSPATVAAQWHTEHYLTLDFTGCGSAVPTLADSGWFDEDTWQPIFADTFVVDGADTFFFVQWLGGEVADPFSYSTTAHITAPDTITALYGSTPFFIRVTPPETTFTSNEPFDLPIIIYAPVPVAVSKIYIEIVHNPLDLTGIGVLEASVSWDSISYTVLSDRISVRCFGDRMISSGDSLFHVRYSPSTPPITEIYTTNPGDDIAIADIDSGVVLIAVPVNVQLIGSHDSLRAKVDGEEHLLPYSFEAIAWDTMELDCDSIQIVAGSQLSFIDWSDTTLGVRQRILVPTGDTTITATYDQLTCILTILTDNHCSGDGPYYFPRSSEVNHCVCNDSVHEGNSYHLFTGWIGTGSGSFSGADTCFTITINNDITEYAQWDSYHYLNLDYSGCGAAVPALVGENWYIEGTDASISAPDSVDDAGTWYYFQYWNGSVADIFAENTTITMDSPHTITASYGSSPIAQIVEIPDTIFAAPGCYFFVPLIFHGDASLSTA